MPSVTYRRPSMITLYEKLQAQGDNDDDTWFADVNAPLDLNDKPSSTYPTSSWSPPSDISSRSSSSSSLSPSQSSLSPAFNDESESSSDEDSGSESEVDFMSLSPELQYVAYEDIYHPPAFKTEEVVDRSDLLGAPSPDQLFILPIPQIVDERIKCQENPDLQLLDDMFVKSAFYNPNSPTPTQPPTRSRRSTSHNSQRVAQEDSDADAEGESDGDATDDEYMPSPSLQSCKRRRNRSETPSSPVSDHSDPAASCTRKPKRPRQSPLPRNIQLAADTDPSHNSSRSRKANPWACPHCSWVQRNHRTPDLKRHIRTHTRSQRPAQWVCCGVAEEVSNTYKLPEDARPYMFQNHLMIGGCGKEFSRRDALKRHLDNKHITCVGDLSIFAQMES
ncbi:hypothetical protein BJ138DRAFT_1100840 [Hygrophoropsis aurantiaca]|uniref:Uncharacterized protein n=1 Tax=Hygrophoropsis aurantiaca TaxID=72124 RepID=A0ACB8AF53_9AGAM|nr:hypothetical protein BJ138DRAFT_1100840 [Hygrophoropsis aurantiaca]